mgnify:FL=1
MNYFENIEGLLEPMEDSIENIERKVEKSDNDSENNEKEESYLVKLSALSQDDVIEIATQQLETLNTILVMQDFGEDISEALNILKERLDACLLVISDKEKKREILTAMKKAFGNTKDQETETVIHK